MSGTIYNNIFDNAVWFSNNEYFFKKISYFNLLIFSGFFVSVNTLIRRMFNCTNQWNTNHRETILSNIFCEAWINSV